jgi:hypothetical protein
MCTSVRIIQHINGIKDKKMHNDFKRCRKSLQQNSASLHDKTLRKLEMEGPFLNMKKVTYFCITLNTKNLKSFPPNSGIDKGVYSLYT